MWTYPTDDLCRGRKLLGLLGTLWAQTYAGRDAVGALVAARGEAEQQAWLDLMETVRAFSRYEVPVFHRRNWYLHVVSRSAALEANPAWAVPADLVKAPMIVNRLADPSVALTAGTDYHLIDGVLFFRDDPFADGRWGTRPVFTDGVQTDTELFLWVFRGEFDLERVYTQWGYVLGLALASSEAYRDLLNALFDSVVSGAGLAQVQVAFAAMTGLPLAAGGETVEQIVQDRRGYAVVTDRGAYRLPPDAPPDVGVGDELTPGQSLTAGLKFADLNRGEVPDWVTAVALGRGFLVGDFHSDLVFENRTLPLAVTTGDDGLTRVEFPIGGFPLDVEAFWAATHENGVAAGVTLAQALDTRTNKVGEPGPLNLPAELNPVQFLVENVLRYNCLVVRVKMEAIAPGAIGLAPARLLRHRVTPPGTALLVLVEVSPQAHTVILNDAPTAAAAGGASALGAFSGATTTAEALGEAGAPHRARAWSVAGSCLTD